jgi:hypothetical protein
MSEVALGRAHRASGTGDEQAPTGLHHLRGGPGVVELLDDLAAYDDVEGARKRRRLDVEGEEVCASDPLAAALQLVGRQVGARKDGPAAAGPCRRLAHEGEQLSVATTHLEKGIERLGAE